MIRAWRLALALLCLTGCATSRMSEEDRFVDRYAPLAEKTLARIHAHPMTPKDRYLILSNHLGYVQCLFHDNDTQLYCEAASDYYFSRRHIPPTQRQAIHALGFAMRDDAGNFRLDSLPVRDEADLHAAARLMLRTMYEGYPAPSQELKIEAPLGRLTAKR